MALTPQLKYATISEYAHHQTAFRVMLRHGCELTSASASCVVAATTHFRRPQLLKDGYKLVAEKGYEVTDDVSIVEFLGAPVKITKVRNLEWCGKLCAHVCGCVRVGMVGLQFVDVLISMGWLTINVILWDSLPQGSYENLKVTTPEDLLIAERLLDERAAKNVTVSA